MRNNVDGPSAFEYLAQPVAKSAPENLRPHQLLTATEFYIGWVGFGVRMVGRINVYEFDDPIRVLARSGYVELRR